MGSKKSHFFAPKSTIWTPPKLLQSLAVNTDPVDVDMVPQSPSPVPPPVILSPNIRARPNIVDCSTLTSPIPTESVACFTDSFADLEFAALLKDTSRIDALQETLEATQNEFGRQKGMFCRLERDFKTMKENYETTLKDLEAKTTQKRLDDRNIADLKDSITDLRTQLDSIKADQGALPLLHQILYYITAPDLVYMDKAAHNEMLYRALASSHSSTSKDITKNYHKLIRLCHPDRHPHLSRHISQQLIAIHNVLKDEATRRIYDCCGMRAVTRKDTTHFCRVCNPRPEYESCDDLWK